MLEIAYVAGEASGDRHAAALHRALVLAAPEGEAIRAWGIGGTLMQAAGVELFADSSRWGGIGIVQSLGGVPTYARAFARLKARLLERRPALLVLVDFGHFNVRLARWARQAGIGPVVYYLPPGSWRTRASPKQSAELGRLCDLIVTPFQWSRDHLKAAGANAQWVGHPLVDIAVPTLPAAQFDREFGVDANRPIIALLPGSRSFEVKYNLPAMLEAAAIVNSRVPGSQFLLAAAPNLDRAQLERMLHRAQRGSRSPFRIIVGAGSTLRRLAGAAIGAVQAAPTFVTNEGVRIVAPAENEAAPERHGARSHSADLPATLAVVENLTYDCLSRSDLAITASGTATLETAILGRPMIIVYRVSKLMTLEYRLRRRQLAIDFIGLPNIIAGREIVPELLQDDASPEAIAELAVGMLVEPQRLVQLRKELAQAIGPAVGQPGSVARAAASIWQVVQSGSSAAAKESEGR